MSINVYILQSGGKDSPLGTLGNLQKCPGNGYSRSFSIQTEPADLNGSPKIGVGFQTW